MSELQSCPCGSGNTLEKCCAPYLSGERNAPTAEALMRSRYTAYVLHDDGYLRNTWLESTRPPEDESPSEDEGLSWTGLSVVRTAAGGENDREGVVEFIAHCEVNGEPGHLHEISHFRRADGRWLYVDGERGEEGAQAASQPQRRAEPKVGRNDPCPCGSGKKYKKCCGT